MRIKYEVQLWVFHFLKLIPGQIGCAVRRWLLPCKMADGARIWEDVHIFSPSRLELGRNVSINRGSVIHAGAGCRIGDNSAVGPGVIIYSQNHVFRRDDIPYIDQGYDLLPVIIGKNTWVAARAVILPGVTIGDNCVIAAGAVVTRDVPSGVLVGGVPARVIRELFPINPEK